METNSKSQQESHIQANLCAYICPDCKAGQLISKPETKQTKLTHFSIIVCAGCSVRRKVRRFANGTYNSFKLNS